MNRTDYRSRELWLNSKPIFSQQTKNEIKFKILIVSKSDIKYKFGKMTLIISANSLSKKIWTNKNGKTKKNIC